MADYINKIRTTEGDKPVNYEALANKPNSLPNPNKIKFTGSVVAEYDGSSEVTVNIPNGASEEQAAQIQTNTNDISELKNKTSELKGDLVKTIREVTSGNAFLEYANGNLFTLAEDVKNGYFSFNSNGVLVYNESEGLACFTLELIKNKKYSCTRSSYAVFLDSDKKPISSNQWDLSNFVSFESGDASYISITCSKNDVNNYAISLGDTLDRSELTFNIDWLMRNIYTKEETDTNINLNNDEIKNLIAVYDSALKEDAKSGNLYAEYYIGNLAELSTDIKEGYYYHKSGNKLVSSVNEVFYCFIIPVLKNKIYTAKNISYIVLLDENKNAINSSGSWDEKIDKYHFDSGDASYVAISSFISQKDITCINVGNKTVSELIYGKYYYIDWLMQNIYTKDECNNNFAPKDEILCNLPPVIYGVVGKELNIYFDNIVDGHDSDYDFDITCQIGRQLDRCFRVVPTTSGEYDFSINISKYGVTKTFKSKIKIADANAKSGITKTVIVMGDSTTEQGYAMSTLYNVFKNDVMNITLLGTNGESPRNHEGRSGFSMATYFTNTDGNPFYNPNTSTFDADYYFNNSGVAKPDWFFINMGINDSFGYSNDRDLLLSFENNFGKYSTVVESVKQASPSSKIGICITIPPNYRQEAFGISYGCNQTQKRYKRNNMIYVQKLIETFKNRESENIYLVPLSVNIDTLYNFGGTDKKVNAWNETTYKSFSEPDGVHPSESGCGQNADSYYFFLKNNG